jgi:serine/threonine protein kinase
VAQRVQRWIEVTPSQFTHEAEGLGIIRALLPDQSPFRAWSNFEFRDGQGKWHEVDLLVLGRRRLHLVELKYYAGTLRGDDYTWRREGRRAEDSPLKLARRKAQRLASKLQDELLHFAQETGHQVPDPRTVVPFVQEAVFLHHPGLRCQLPRASRIDLFGLDEHEDESGLDGISERLLEAATPHQSVPSSRDGAIAALMARIGVVQRRQREAGSWIIDEDPIGEGDGWQDWPAFHHVATTNRARIRFRVSVPGASSTERARVRQVAEHEYRIMHRLPNERLLRPLDIVDNDLGVGLVYPLDERFQRLDLFLADNAGQVSARNQISLLREVAEALSYAHRNRIVHRGLTPHAVLVRVVPEGKISVMVGDWQSAGTATGPALTGLPSRGITGLMGISENPSHSPERSGVTARPGVIDVDRRLAEAFQAPEGVWNRDADRIRIDVFALGALSYYVLSGRLPAADRTTLRERLNRDGGLDLAVDLPQVAPALRALVLDATRPAVTERLPDVRTFLEAPAPIESVLSDQVDDAADPLDAVPGAVIDGRFRLQRHLGRGSTAAGLLVNDLTIAESGPDSVRVLKVAIDGPAAGRIADEAKVLSGLRHPRVVRLVEGPIDVGGRQALVLESAGDETLGEVLRRRERLSLDLLERWGTELLEALVVLDRAGVDHRDIKPANLGVREGRGDRAKHLVLFDFSLSSAGATAVTAGTPPYLDPFLDTPRRGRYDSAAERYSAAVVLFEMATGTVPRFGDGLSDPASVQDEATIETGMFDPAISGSLVGFFRIALARDARQRHDTATEMLAGWQAVFQPVPKTVPDDAEELAAKATLSTPLAMAGLSARALSAVEPLVVTTVGDLVAVDPVRLNHLSGVAEATRREVKSRARQWRVRLGAAITGRGTTARTGMTGGTSERLPDPVEAASLLMAHAGTTRAESRRALARLVLGLDEGMDAFATQGELAQASGVTRGRVPQQLGALQDGWAADTECGMLLDSIAEAAWQSLDDSGGVATVSELAQAVLAVMPPADAGVSGTDVERVAAGLLRLALDRAQARIRAEDAEGRQFFSRRRDGRIVLLAANQALLDPAEALGRTVDELIAQAAMTGESLVPVGRAGERLLGVWTRAVSGEESAPGIPDAGRLMRLAAALSQDAALAGSGDLYALDMPATVALAIALSGVGAQPVSAQEVHSRTRAKFPALPPLPDRPKLDQLIADTGLDLIYDEGERAYRSPTRAPDTRGLSFRPATVLGPLNRQLLTDGPSGHRLAESAATRSFLAIGVDARYMDMAIAALASRFGVEVIDVTGVLIDAMKAQASEVGLDWDIVRAADAAPAGTRDAEGLSVLVQRSLPAIETAVTEATARPEGTRPVLLTEVAPLARYQHLTLLGPWADLATRRRQAIWVLVPQLAGSQGALIDRRPLPLAAPGQYMRLDPEWIAAHRPTSVSEGER